MSGSAVDEICGMAGHSLSLHTLACVEEYARVNCAYVICDTLLFSNDVQRGSITYDWHNRGVAALRQSAEPAKLNDL